MAFFRRTILCSGQILIMLALASWVNRGSSQSMPNLIDLAWHLLLYQRRRAEPDVDSERTVAKY